MRFLGIVVLAAVLAACGESSREEGKTPAPSSRDDDAIVRVRGGEEGEDPGDSTPDLGPAAPQSDLRLRITLDRKSFEVGEEIPAVLDLTNAGAAPTEIYDPARALTADLEIRVVTPAGSEVVIRQHREIPEESVRKEDLVTLARGEGGSATVDLAPALRTAGDGAVGMYAVEIAFTGGQQGNHLSMGVWNRRGTKRASAAAVEIRLTWPEELAAAGITPALSRDVESLLSRVREGGTLTEGALSGLRAHGERVIPLLIRKLALASSRTPKTQAVAWNAYGFLQREVGKAALEALADVDGEEAPLARMLRRMIEEDLVVASPDDRPPARARQALTEPSLSPRLLLAVEWDRGARENRDTLTICGDGAARWGRSLRGGERVRDGRLDSETLRTLFGVLVEERIWLQEAVRPFGKRGEARIGLSLVLRPIGGRGPEEDLVRFSVWETEATLLNRSLARVMKAVGAAAELIE